MPRVKCTYSGCKRRCNTATLENAKRPLCCEHRVGHGKPDYWAKFFARHQADPEWAAKKRKQQREYYHRKKSDDEWIAKRKQQQQKAYRKRANKI